MSKVVFITGASSGIGKAIGTYLHQRGFVVYGTSRNPKSNIVDFNLIQLDVLDTDSIKKAIEIVLAKETKIDVLINNAGRGITGSVEDTPIDEIKQNFDTNLFGVINVIKSVLPIMRTQRQGLIINVTSIAGYMGLPFRGIYSASKGALAIVSEAISMEVQKQGIDVVTLAPGDFATNIASGRYHTPVLENSAYKEAYAENLALMDTHVDAGQDPIKMAEVVYKVINSKNRKIHYKVGAFMERFSIVLKRILPDKWYQKLLMNHYRL